MPRSRAVWAMVVVPPVASRTASALNSGVYFRRARGNRTVRGRGALIPASAGFHALRAAGRRSRTDASPSLVAMPSKARVR